MVGCCWIIIFESENSIIIIINLFMNILSNKFVYFEKIYLRCFSLLCLMRLSLRVNISEHILQEILLDTSCDLECLCRFLINVKVLSHTLHENMITFKTENTSRTRETRLYPSTNRWVMKYSKIYFTLNNSVKWFYPSNSLAHTYNIVVEKRSVIFVNNTIFKTLVK